MVLNFRLLPEESEELQLSAFILSEVEQKNEQYSWLTLDHLGCRLLLTPKALKLFLALLELPSCSASLQKQSGFLQYHTVHIQV
jgi:hypothetical protein